MTEDEMFNAQAISITGSFPKLQSVVSDAGKTIVKGEIDIIDREGKFWESYQIEIHPVKDFPYRYPWVFEVGGKIPRIGDWHIWDDTMNCCMGIEPEEILKCQGGISLEVFIKDVVVPYFFNQTFRRQEGYYPNGEYAHNVNGIFQYYDQLLKTNGDVKMVIRAMMFILQIEKPGRTSDCFCGSGEKYRRCHRLAVEKIKKLGNDIIMYHANWLSKAYRVAF